MKKISRNDDFYSSDDNINDDYDLNNVSENELYNQEPIYNEPVKQEIPDDKENKYVVVNKNDKIKLFACIGVAAVISLIVVISNANSTKTQHSKVTTAQSTTVITETSTDSAPDTTLSSTTEKEYRLPSDLSVFGTWGWADPTRSKDYFVVNYDKTWKYVLHANKNDYLTLLGDHATAVCGEKALAKTGWSWEKVRSSYNIEPFKFNIDNFYYVRFPVEYRLNKDGVKEAYTDDFEENVDELYLYLYNDKNGSLKAYNLKFSGADEPILEDLVLLKEEGK